MILIVTDKRKRGTIYRKNSKEVTYHIENSGIDALKRLQTTNAIYTDIIYDMDLKYTGMSFEDFKAQLDKRGFGHINVNGNINSHTVKIAVIQK